MSSDKITTRKIEDNRYVAILLIFTCKHDYFTAPGNPCLCQLPHGELSRASCWQPRAPDNEPRVQARSVADQSASRCPLSRWPDRRRSFTSLTLGPGCWHVYRGDLIELDVSVCRGRAGKAKESRGFIVTHVCAFSLLVFPRRERQSLMLVLVFDIKPRWATGVTAEEKRVIPDRQETSVVQETPPPGAGKWKRRRTG